MTILKLNPVHIAVDLFKHRYLIGQLVRRDVLLKYKGSFLGIGWSFLYPLLLLSSFTLVFSGVFGGRWKGGSGGMQGLEYAIFIL
jgi:lipopolysaccharide transport system permease protein